MPRLHFLTRSTERPVFPSGDPARECLATPSFLLEAGPGPSDARQAAAGPARLEAKATPLSLCGNLHATGHRSQVGRVLDLRPLLEEREEPGARPACERAASLCAQEPPREECWRTGPPQHQIGKESRSWRPRQRSSFPFRILFNKVNPCRTTNSLPGSKQRPFTATEHTHSWKPHLCNCFYYLIRSPA